MIKMLIIVLKKYIALISKYLLVWSRSTRSTSFFWRTKLSRSRLPISRASFLDTLILGSAWTILTEAAASSGFEVLAVLRAISFLKNCPNYQMSTLAKAVAANETNWLTVILDPRRTHHTCRSWSPDEYTFRNRIALS